MQKARTSEEWLLRSQLFLRGKNKPTYTPHVDCGDYVIVINAEKVEVTGKKRKEKIYKRHTGYPGGLREMTFEQMMEKHPTEVVRHAVKGMMPNGKLGRQMYKKLKVYAGPEHESCSSEAGSTGYLRRGGIKRWQRHSIMEQEEENLQLLELD